MDERYCTVEESLIASLKEVKLMREGKLPKQYWRDYQDELRKMIEEERAKCST